jgi:hypothetical protein
MEMIVRRSLICGGIMTTEKRIEKMINPLEAEVAGE